MKIKKYSFKLKIVLFCMSLFPLCAVSQTVNEMISPISNPVNFEDPRIISEIRPIYAYHKIDNNFITQGGDVRLYALQLRYAVSDDLAVIATKDGWIDFNPNSVLNDESGFANLAGGVKYSFFKSKESDQIASAGIKYEIPTGEKEVLQGKGDGVFNPFVSYGFAGCGLNFIAGTGFRLPLSDNDSTFYDLDLHLDTKIGNFYPLIEMNMVHVLNAGERLPIPDEGQDLFNFGSSGSEGESILTAAAGMRYAISKEVSIGAAYQFPLNRGSGSNIIDYRVISDLTINF